MKTIHKFTMLAYNGSLLSLPFPDGAEPLTVQMQEGLIQLWVMLHDDQPRNHMRHFAVCGTGRPMPDDVNHKYIGTVQEQTEFGPMVWHVFEEIQ